MRTNTPKNMDEESLGESYINANDIDDEIEIIDEAEFVELNDDEEEEDEDDADEDDNAAQRTTRDDSQLIFNGHRKSAMCCALSANGSIAFTGGQDDRAFLWKTNSGEIVFECVGHKDSVISVGFSRNDTYFASCDMSGYIQVWKSDTFEKVFDYEVDDINWMEWHPQADSVLLCGTASGEAWLFNVADTNMFKMFQSYGSGNTTGKIFADGKRSAMGYEDGVVRIWDLKAGSVLHTIADSPKATVNTIAVNSDDTLTASGSTDSNVKVINTQTGSVTAVFPCGNHRATRSQSAADSNSDDDVDSVESVAFCQYMSILATGTVNGWLDVWDLSSLQRRQSFHTDAGISKLLWDKLTPHLLYTAGLDGVVRCFDGRSGELQLIKYGHRNHVLDLSVCNGSNLILTASQDATCRVFSLQ